MTEEKKKELKHHIHPHHMNTLLLITIILSILLFLFVKPSVEGYMIKRQFEKMEINPDNILEKLDVMENKVTLIKANSTKYQELSESLKEDYTDMKSELITCQNAKNALESEVRVADQQCLTELKAQNISMQEEMKMNEMEMKQAMNEAEDYRQKYLNLAKKSARSICCKDKVDDPSINSYDILNDAVVCSSEGDHELQC